jgi:flagellar motor switch protein FliM
MEILSQDEIDQLLTAISAGDTEPEDFRPAREGYRIKIYDFKRPDKFSREQIRTISMMYDNFARSVTSLFSGYFRKMVHVHVASVDQLTYEEFIRSIPTPATIAVISMDPLPGSAAIEIDPAISNSMINRLFGGEGEYNCKPHTLTDLERVSLEDILNKLVFIFRDTWGKVVSIMPEIARIETDPQFIQIAPPCEMVILVMLEVRFGDVEDMINVCLPYSILEPIMQKLSASFWYSGDRQNVVSSRKRLAVESIPVLMKAELFSRASTMGEILNWQEGTVIYPHGEIDFKNCHVKIGSLIVFDAEIVKSQNIYNQQICINKLLKPYKECFMESNSKLAGEFDSPGVASALKDVNIEVSVELGRTRKMVKEILSMGEGTIVELDKLAGEPVDILANNVPIAKGEVVVVDENFGVRVTELLNTEKAEENTHGK